MIKDYPYKDLGSESIDFHYIEWSLDVMVSGVTKDGYRIWAEDIENLLLQKKVDLTNVSLHWDITQKRFCR